MFPAQAGGLRGKGEIKLLLGSEASLENKNMLKARSAWPDLGCCIFSQESVSTTKHLCTRDGISYRQDHHHFDL